MAIRMMEHQRPGLGTLGASDRGTWQQALPDVPQHPGRLAEDS